MRSISRLAPPEPAASTAVADDDNTAWLITFSDLVLQLFGFVVLATVLGNARRAAEPPRVATPPAPVAVIVPFAATPVETADTTARPSKAPAEDESLPVIPPPVIVAMAEPAAPTPAVAATAPPVATPPAPEVDALGGRLRELAQAAGRPDGVALSVRDAEVVVTLSDTIGFRSGSADLLPAAVPILAAVRNLAASLPGFAVLVEGHTDDVQIHTAAFPSNLELSLARAARVARELTAGDATLVARTAATGFGEHRPLAPNVDEASRAQNRRVEIRLVRRD